MQISNPYNNFNVDYEEQLKKIIKPEQYHEFTNLLIEIILKRQSEFDLPYDIMIEEANNMVKHLNTIKFVPKNKLANHNWVAQYSHATHSIYISKEFAKKAINGNINLLYDLYEILTHEVYHAIATDDFGNSGFYNKKFESRGFNELINECAANMCSFGYSQADLKRGIRKTNGYVNLTLFSPLIARSLGVTEKIFLTAGISKNAEYKIRDLITKNMHYSDQPLDDKLRIQTENFIISLSKQVDILHNLDCPMNASQINSEDQKPYFREKALTSMIDNIIQIASFRIEHDIRPINSDLVAEYAYSYKGIVGYVNEILGAYKARGLISEQQINTIENATSQQLEELCNRIIGLREVTISIGTKDNKHIQEMINYAKKGILIGNSQCAKYYDVVLPQNKIAEIYNINTTTQHRRVVNADFEIKLWYSYVEEELLNIIYKNIGIEGTINKIVNYIRDLFNSQKRLPPANSQLYNLNARQEAYGIIINNPPKEFSNMKATHKSKPVILRNPNSDNIITNEEEGR